MDIPRTPLARTAFVLLAIAITLGLICCTKKSSAQTATADLSLDLKLPFRFVAYGDTRFHDPNDTPDQVQISVPGGAVMKAAR